VQLINDPNQSGATVMMYISIPIVILLAVLAVRVRRRTIMKHSVPHLNSPEEVQLPSPSFFMGVAIRCRILSLFLPQQVELKARFLLDEYASAMRQRNAWREGSAASMHYDSHSSSSSAAAGGDSAAGGGSLEFLSNAGGARGAKHQQQNEDEFEGDEREKFAPDLASMDH
jgi:hypothetical protein